MNIQPQTIRLIVEIISKKLTEKDIVRILKIHEVDYLNGGESLEDNLTNSLLALVKSQNQDNKNKLHLIIEDLVHPLVHKTQIKNLFGLVAKINKWLKYDNLQLLAGLWYAGTKDSGIRRSWFEHTSKR